MPKNNSIRSGAARLTVFAMLTAISVVVGILCKNLFTVGVYYRFTLENIGVIFAGIFFGPGAGALVGVAVDVISCLLSANPAVNPVITLGALTVGVSAGVVSRYIVRERGLRQYILSAATAHLLGQVIIKSVGKIIYFGMPWIGIFIGLACSVLACAVEVIVIRTLMKNTEIRKFVFRITGEK
jgi:ECF transporter S component (folate family)